MSNIHTLQKIFPAGFDNGYGSLKLLVDGNDIVRVPSYITNADMEDVPGRVIFNGSAYTVGESAFRTGYHLILSQTNLFSRLKSHLLLKNKRILMIKPSALTLICKGSRGLP